VLITWQEKDKEECRPTRNKNAEPIMNFTDTVVAVATTWNRRHCHVNMQLRKDVDKMVVGAVCLAV
jgi:hypothetical protein